MPEPKPGRPLICRQVKTGIKTKRANCSVHDGWPYKMAACARAYMPMTGISMPINRHTLIVMIGSLERQSMHKDNARARGRA